MSCCKQSCVSVRVETSMNLPFRETQGCEEGQRILLPFLPYLGAAEEYESSSTRQIIQEQFF